MSFILPYYEQKIQQGDIRDDIRQRHVLMHFERIAKGLCTKRLFLASRRSEKILGLYLYGSVGAGKTFLMDLFFDHIPIEKKKRFHFHHFMQEVDGFMRAHQGTRDPLRLFAKTWAKSTRLLCIDEFIVNDIAHAMILANLLEALLGQGVVLVATSNTPPELLYQDGLQRARFLKAIDLIEMCCEVVSLIDKRDYRLTHLLSAPGYYYPNTSHELDKMQSQFQAFGMPLEEGGQIEIQSRCIDFLYQSETAIWFDFDVICNIPRSQLDYLELAQKFEAIFISNVPQLTKEMTQRVLLFMHLVDVLYDAKIRLVLQAEVPIEVLYTHLEIIPSFKRTYSRLIEMQSEYYLSKINAVEGCD